MSRWRYKWLKQNKLAFLDISHASVTNMYLENYVYSTKINKCKGNLGIRLSRNNIALFILLYTHTLLFKFLSNNKFYTKLEVLNI